MRCVSREGMPWAGAVGGSRVIPGLRPGLGVQVFQEGIPRAEVCWEHGGITGAEDMGHPRG